MRSPSIIVGADPAQLERDRRLTNLLYAACHHPDAAVRRRAAGLLAQIYADEGSVGLTEMARQARSAA